MATLSNKDIARFMLTLVLPKLGQDFFPYVKKDLARMRGPFVQLLALSSSKSGRFLKVHPTLYVVGADPSFEVISQNVSLEVWAPRKWSFDSPTLGEAFADRLLQQIEAETPISFVQPLDDSAIEAALRRFAAAKGHWNAQFFLAFLSILQRWPNAHEELVAAQKVFDKLVQPGAAGLPPWGKAQLRRFEALRRRIDSANGVEECKKECESHALSLKLPPIAWPTEWFAAG